MQVVENVPYVTTLETMEKHNCDFCAHGGSIQNHLVIITWWSCVVYTDDISTDAEGVDTYASVKAAGKFK